MLRLLGATALSGAALASTPVEPVPPPGQNYLMQWTRFKKHYGKNYTSPVDEEQRFQIFRVNVDFVYAQNGRGNTYELGVTEYADLTADEFSSSHFGIRKPDSLWGRLPSLGTHTYHGEALAESIDWNEKGAVTPLKNQGQCGSCWSFSTTGSLEGAWQIATGKLTPLSEQQFVDCDKVDAGCEGGLMDNAFQFAQENDICTEESYPYKGNEDECSASECTTGIAKGGVVGFKDVPTNDMQAMMSAVSQQPVSIAIEADTSVFQLYQSGVLSGECGDSLDHGVLAVGYGTEDGQDYWLVKNSWGSGWGDNGFIKLLRGKGGSGECGLLKQASYPVVQAASELVV